jgi:dolichol-phosphate mannosyltransferase
MLQKVCVIIPTYNEADNIKRLMDEIFIQEQINNDPLVSVHILVVDDNSPDGTAEIVKEYLKRNSKVHLLFRNEKNGLGAAYIAGMKYALANLKPDIVFEMDADFSHNPKDIFPMIDQIVDGADMVIGSRYVRGGKIPQDWGIRRTVLSKAANTFTRTVLNIRDVQDCTGGFRAFRASALRTIDLDLLEVKGYAFQIAILKAMMDRKYVIREVPIEFRDRTDGESKMKLGDITEVGTVVFRLAFQGTSSASEPAKEEAFA